YEQLDLLAKPIRRSALYSRIASSPCLVQQRLHRLAGQIVEQPRLARRFAKRRRQGDQVLRLLRHCLLKGRQHAGDPKFFVAASWSEWWIRQIPMVPGIALVVSNKECSQQFDCLGVIAAGSGHLVEDRRLAPNAETG